MKVTVAAAQCAPEYGDFEKGIKKAISWVKQAAKEDVQLLVFPELWFLGYPYWASMGTRDPAFQYWLRHFLSEAGPARDPRLKPLLDVARQKKIALSFSVHEKDGGSLYNTQILTNPKGELVSIHRKLIPTNTERLIHGRGDGSDIDVHDFGFGKITGLLCFEHQMTLARAAITGLRTQIHCAQWPGQGFLNPIIDASIRQLAHEAGCFVISARETMSADLLPKASQAGEDKSRWDGVGGSSIAGPNAIYVSEPQHGGEKLVVAELDLMQIMQTKYLVDNVGHYARPDVFQLNWDDRPKPPIKRKSASS